jgi:hypothetical protein
MTYFGVATSVAVKAGIAIGATYAAGRIIEGVAEVRKPN